MMSLFFDRHVACRVRRCACRSTWPLHLSQQAVVASPCSLLPARALCTLRPYMIGLTTPRQPGEPGTWHRSYISTICAAQSSCAFLVLVCEQLALDSPRDPSSWHIKQRCHLSIHAPAGAAC